MPLPDHKYIFWLERADGSNAVVVDWNADEAKQRAHVIAPPGTEWYNAKVRILTRVRRTMLSRVVAMED